MLVKTIKYTDYDNNEREESFRFNLNEAELIELQESVPGGMENLIKSVVEAQDRPQVMKIFKKVIMLSYGEKSADGKRFTKSEELSTAFVQTEAYNKLIMEILTSENAAADFINAIIPKLD